MRLSDRLVFQQLDWPGRLDYVLIDEETSAEFVFSAVELARLVAGAEWFATTGHDQDLGTAIAAARRERDAANVRNVASALRDFADEVMGDEVHRDR